MEFSSEEDRALAGLNLKQLTEPAALLNLAANPGSVTREEIYVAVTSIYRVQGRYLGPRERELLQDIVRRLSKKVGIGTRTSLAERIAADGSVPHDLVLLFAEDDIEAARPIILGSPLLTDDDQVALISKGGTAHREAVAARPGISARVGEALARCDSETVLAALARNATARLSPLAFDLLAGKALNADPVREALARRGDLPAHIAEALGAKRPNPHAFEVGSNALAEACATVGSRLAQPPAPSPQSQENSGNKLIEKLAASGQLRASFLMRVLHQGQIELFDAGLAKLLELPLVGSRNRFYQGGPKAVALACRAVGIDRCVFPTVYALSRRAHGLPHTLHAADMAEVEPVFRTPKAAALATLRA